MLVMLKKSKVSSVAIHASRHHGGLRSLAGLQFNLMAGSKDRIGPASELVGDHMPATRIWRKL
jgi:hypothetical protein